MTADKSSAQWHPLPNELEEFLKHYVRGQPQAIAAIVKHYGFFKAGIKNYLERSQRRPIGVLLFMGPSGVGKSELGKRLAQVFNGRFNSAVMVDMAGYEERHTISSLRGSPHGYVGYQDPPLFSLKRLREITFKDNKAKDKPQAPLPAPPPKTEDDDQNKEGPIFTAPELEKVLNELRLIERDLADLNRQTLIKRKEKEELENEERATSLPKKLADLKKIITDVNDYLDYIGLTERVLILRKQEILSCYNIILWDNVRSSSNKKGRPCPPEKTEIPAPQPKALLAAPAKDDSPIFVIILDEIEKAHPDVHKFLLNVFEEGRIMLADGSETDFSHTIFILTANIAQEQISAILRKKSRQIGFVSADRQQSIAEAVNAELRKVFQEPFLNRLDEIVIFNDLSEANLTEILDLLVEEFALNLQGLNLKIEVRKEAKKLMVQKALKRPECQARGLEQEFKAAVQMPLTQLLVNRLITTGQTVIVRAVNGRIKLKITSFHPASS